MSLSRTFVFVLILGVMISPLSAGDVDDLKAAFALCMYMSLSVCVCVSVCV